MAVKAAVGRGKASDSLMAGRQAAYMTQVELGSRRADLLLVFASARHDSASLLAGIREFYPETPMIGCSTAGEIYSDGADAHTVVITAICGVKVCTDAGGDISADAAQAGALLGGKLKGQGLKAVLMFSDGLAGNGAAVIRGLQADIGAGIPVIGGSAGDDFQFKQSFQYVDGQVLSRSVVGAGLHGDFHFGVGVRHGWEPVGLPVRVTKSAGHRLLELNHQPAINFYEDYFGEYTDRLRHEPLGSIAVSYPLGMAVTDSQEFLLRAPLTVEAGGAITCAAEIPEGAEVRLMIGSVERAIASARIAAMEALSQMEGSLPALALVFNCVSRRRVLGRRAIDEIMTIRDIVGRKVPLMGFYAYGEIAPVEGIKTNPSVFHNSTVVVMTLG